MFIYDKLELETVVEECYEHEGNIYVVLKDTVFYPEGGGQKCDVGMIDSFNVLSVFKRDGKIIHCVDEEVSGNVLCVVNKDVRYMHSKLHTAQHLLSAVFVNSGYETTSLSMKDNYYTIDIIGKVSREVLDENEKEINKLIRDKLEVITRSYDSNIDSELDISYLGVDERLVRVVIIDNLDKNICGGTHINNLSELQFLKIVSYKYSGEKTRIDVMIGEEAIDYVNNCFNEYCSIVKLINQVDVDAYSYIENKLKEHKKFKKQLSNIEKRNRNE